MEIYKILRAEKPFFRSISMKELNVEQMAAVEGGGCWLNMVAGAMLGGAVGGVAGAVGGAATMGLVCVAVSIFA